jgi:Zn-dependent protease with chaperone function
MDFFEHQADARKRTRLLVFYYVLAVATIVVSVYLVVMFGISTRTPEGAPPVGLWDPTTFGLVALVVGGVIALGTLFKTAEMSTGGRAVAEMLDGRLIGADTRDPNERRLLNIVEEMAIASGVPVPPVYLLEESGINAFAAGFKPSDAVIGVTRGCIEQLSRDELQGVIAHEFSHILNGDMRLNLRLIGVLFGILLLTVLGRAMLRIGFYSGGSRRSSRNEKGGGGAAAIMFLGFALVVIGYIGVFFGRLIKSAVSRQREFLADASAVQYTRNPDGIAGALSKIAALHGGSRIESAHAEEASHLFFANGLTDSWTSLMATHPPLDERIRRIQPYLAGAPDGAPSTSRAVSGAAGAGTGATAGVAGLSGFGGAAFTASIGTLDPRHLDYAAGLIRRIPEAVRDLVRTPDGAQAAVFALLLSREQAAFDKQLESLAQHVGDDVLRHMEKWSGDVQDLPFSTRMPLVDLALPALQQMKPEAYRVFRETVEQMTDADGRVSVFEFALMRSLMRNLEPVFGRPNRDPVRYHSLKQVMDSCLPLVALLAWYGNEADPGRAAADFAAGLQVLGLEPQATALPGKSDDPVGLFEAALEVLRYADGAVKKRVLEACAVAVTANDEVTVEEAELLRAVADSLDCPVPPLVPTTEKNAMPA